MGNPEPEIEPAFLHTSHSDWGDPATPVRGYYERRQTKESIELALLSPVPDHEAKFTVTPESPGDLRVTRWHQYVDPGSRVSRDTYAAPV